MAQTDPNWWMKPAIRIVAAGLGTAVAGPLGGTLGGFLGGAFGDALGKPAGELIQKYAEKFGEGAAEKLLENGGDSLAERLKDSASDLPELCRESLRISLAELRRHAGDASGDWFDHWDACLRKSILLDLDDIQPSQSAPNQFDVRFRLTFERLDAQGAQILQGGTSLLLKTRVIPSPLFAEVKSRLPTYFKKTFRTLIVQPEYEQAWKRAEQELQYSAAILLSSIKEDTTELKANTALIITQIDAIQHMLSVNKEIDSNLGAQAVEIRPDGLALWPINGSGMNVVRKVEDNDKPNGNFWFSLALQLLPGTYAIDLLQFQAIYWANGCPCLNLEPTLKIGDEIVKLMGDDKSLKQPIRLQASGISLQYSRHLRPPLQKDTPEECDYGDVTINLSYREANKPAVITEEKCFRFLPGGKLDLIAAIRPVPRLTDEQLKSCYEAGGIDQITFERLVAIDSVTRYMGARSDVGENFVPNKHDLKTLRRILTEGCGLDW